MIDAVITWVSNDVQHALKREKFQIGPLHSSSTSPTRFSSRGEIKYCLWSLIRFCPFLRKIFIVTDGQQPEELQFIIKQHPESAERLVVVDHQTIFSGYEDLLPVFSSRSIETMLYRIPGLAERFLYLNDDMFVTSALKADFFFESTRPIVQGDIKRLPNPVFTAAKKMLRPGVRRAGFKEAQQKAAKAVGRCQSYVLAGHHPHALLKSTFSDYYSSREAELRDQASYRFRSDDQYSPIGLANNLELNRGSVVRNPARVGYIKPPRNNRALTKLAYTLKALEHDEFDSLCVQSLDQMDDLQICAVFSALEARLKI